MPTHNLIQDLSAAKRGRRRRERASPDRSAARCWRICSVAGFGSEIYPINPKYDSLLGLPALSVRQRVAAAAGFGDHRDAGRNGAAVSCRECGEAGVPGLIILSAGFSEVGPGGREIEAELSSQLARFPDMRIIGPNCLGVMVPSSRLNASFAAGMAKPGRVAFISQSGALCTSILDWSLAEGIGFSYFVSIGNALNVKVGDLIDYLAEDPTTDSIVLYLESVTRSAAFHVGGAGLYSHQADRCLQSRPVRRIGASGRLAHRCHGRCRCRVRSRLSTGRHGSRLSRGGHVRLCRTVGPPTNAGGSAVGHHHQRRRARRYGCRRIARTTGTTGQALARHDRQT